MIDVVIRIVAEQLNVPPESLDSNSSYATVPDWDSLATVRIALAIEEEFNLSLSMKELLSIQSVRGIVDILACRIDSGV